MNKEYLINKTRYFSYLVLLTLLFTGGIYGQSEKQFKDAVEKSRAAIKQEMAKNKLPGLSVAVAVNGKLIWSEGFGLADLESNIPVTTATKFRLASSSKPITATAMAKLYEQGKLDIDAPIQKYVPYFPVKKEGVITARQLSGNRSGIRHYRRDPNPEKDEFFTRTKFYKNVRESVRYFEDDPLDFSPGSRYGYTSYGFTLLSAVIEGASGQDFFDHMKNEIFVPLKMNSTEPDVNKAVIKDRARPYSLENKTTIINAPYIDHSNSWGGGGFISTPEDLVRFGSALLSPGFLKKETLKEMFTSQYGPVETDYEYGFGWRIINDSKGLRYYHPGGAIGGQSYFIIHPEQKLVIALVHNLTGGSLNAGVAVSNNFVEEINKSK